MPILAKKPYIDADGFEYPFLTVHSFIVRAEQKGKDFSAPVVLNMQPFRVLPDNTPILATVPGPLDEFGQPTGRNAVLVNWMHGDAYAAAQTDPAVAQALQLIFGGLAQFIDAKGF